MSRFNSTATEARDAAPFVSPRVAGVQYEVIHINAEYSDQASDHDPQVLRMRR